MTSSKGESFVHERSRTNDKLKGQRKSFEILRQRAFNSRLQAQERMAKSSELGKRKIQSLANLVAIDNSNS
jgi:hypothetical protein